MAKTYKHQNRWNYLNDNRKLSNKDLFKLLNWFNRINFWDWDLKILYRKHKDYIRGGKARIKGKKYK